MEETILRVAVPSPVPGSFDYLPPPDSAPNDLRAGARVRVKFGRQTMIGLILAMSRHPRVSPNRLKPIIEVLDPEPILDAHLLRLLTWASDYYHHPIGEVISCALPALLRQGRPVQARGITRWHLTEAGRMLPADSLKRAPRQARLVDLLRRHSEGLDATGLSRHESRWREPLRALKAKGLVVSREDPCLPKPPTAQRSPPPLNSAQTHAVEAVIASLGRFSPFLLEGVTGSGKTEVYLKIIERVLGRGRQALVLVPEIGLTPQLIDRFQARFRAPIAALHSRLTDTQRLCAWAMAREGKASIVIGTRSAIYTPLSAPGVIIIDEEHDPSFKQHEGFRYNARDLAILRAKAAAVPVVLGSATPSLESLNNVLRANYELLRLPQRAGEARHPRVEVIDMRRKTLHDGVSEALLRKIGEHLHDNGQVLLFLNRRGYAPTIICHDCGWLADCVRCDARMTLHAGVKRLVCHHCGGERPQPTHCPNCNGTELRPLGQGTERLELLLRQCFPETSIVRIDRDSTRRRGAMQSKLKAIHSGKHRILIGTQMLAKGHHFPELTLVGVLNADQGLLSADFRGPERTAQLLVQVAGRAGRGNRPGEVVIQTYQPDNALLHTLITKGYRAFCDAALEERRAARLPPFTRLALVRAEAPDAEAPMQFLRRACEAATRLQPLAGVSLTGPAPAPMERRAGRYRAHLLIQSDEPRALQRMLTDWVAHLAQCSGANRVRWSIDVDPMEMF